MPCSCLVKVFNYLIIYVGRPARALPAVYPIRHNGARLKLLLNNPPIRTHPMRIFNFSAGPAVLPEPVLRRAAAEMLDWHGSGMSVMEMSHRGREFTRIAAKTQADFVVGELSQISINIFFLVSVFFFYPFSVYLLEL